MNENYKHNAKKAPTCWRAKQLALTSHSGKNQLIGNVSCMVNN